MRRLNIKFSKTLGEEMQIHGGAHGLNQIADFARKLAAESGDHVVCFEVFWPGQTVVGGVWDALRVDTSKIDAWDGDDWWVVTLPPYIEMSDADRRQLGIRGSKD